jgi:Predicted membrane protein
MKKKTVNTRFLVELAVLIAIELLLEVTGLGYIKTPFLEMTIMQVPVIVGAIVLGPLAGTILGAVFGLTSFFECFGKSVFGATLLGISPFSTFIVCVIPRLLMGLLCALVFKWLKGMKKTSLRCGISGLCGALFNTVLFMGFLVALFAKTDFIGGFIQQFGNGNIFKFVVAFVGVQGLIEAIICCVVGASVSYALLKFKK